MGLGGMVSEVPVGFLWAPVIADLDDIIRRKEKIEKVHEALIPWRFFEKKINHSY